MQDGVGKRKRIDDVISTHQAHWNARGWFLEFTLSHSDCRIMVTGNSDDRHVKESDEKKVKVHVILPQFERM